MTAQPGLCQTWSETPQTGFLTTRLKVSGNKGMRKSSIVFNSGHIQTADIGDTLPRKKCNNCSSLVGFAFVSLWATCFIDRYPAGKANKQC